MSLNPGSPEAVALQPVAEQEPIIKDMPLLVPEDFIGLSYDEVDEVWQHPDDPETKKKYLEHLEKEELAREEAKFGMINEVFDTFPVERMQAFIDAHDDVESLVAQHIAGEKAIDGLLPEEAAVMNKLVEAYKEYSKKNPDTPFEPKISRNVEEKVLANLKHRLAFEVAATQQIEPEQYVAPEPVAEVMQPQAIPAPVEQVPVPAPAPVAEVVAESKVITQEQQRNKTEGPINWQEVHRDTEVLGIGDLNGSYEGFVENLKSQNVIEVQPDGALKWIGGDKQLTFVGDILGDRSPEGLKIVEGISNLEKQGANIDKLAGNHDNFFLSFIGGINAEGVSQEKSISQYVKYGYDGVAELLSYAHHSIQTDALTCFINSSIPKIELQLEANLKRSEAILKDMQEKHPTFTIAIDAATQNVRKHTEKYNEYYALKKRVSSRITPDDVYIDIFPHLLPEHKINILTKLYKDRSNTLRSMMNTAEGKSLLEKLCTFKLVTKKDDTIFVHTNMTKKMAEMLNQGDSLEAKIDMINSIYQKGLRASILNEPITQEESELFDEVRTVFLDTDNRNNFVGIQHEGEPQQKNSMVDAFKKKGVNMIVHGHNDESGAVLGSPEELPIVSIDRSAFKSGGNKDKRAIFEVQKNGEVKMGENHEMIRTL